jgi:hypothetical protein
VQVPPVLQSNAGRRPQFASARGSEYAMLSRRVRRAGLLGSPAALLRLEDRVHRAGARGRMDRVRHPRQLVVAARHRRVPGGGLHPDRIPGPRRRAPPGLPLTARQLCPRRLVRQSGHRAQLRLVDRQAQPPPRPPEHRGRRPRHHDQRAGRSPAAGRGRAGAPGGWPSATRPTSWSRCCFSRRSACTPPASGR